MIGDYVCNFDEGTQEASVGDGLQVTNITPGEESTTLKQDLKKI